MHEVVYESDKVTIKDVIDEALSRDDKRVYILINGETASISIEPIIEEEPPHWIYNGVGLGYTCSSCESPNKHASKYCPNCGEKMKYLSILKEKQND